MRQWPKVKMGELFHLEKGKIGIKAATPGAFPLVTTGEQHLSHIEPHFSGESICIPLISATGHGHASLKRLHYIEGEFAVGSILCSCVNRAPDHLSTRYVFYYLSACKDAVLIPLMQGTANMSMKVSDIAGVEIPLPPLAEQQAIVSRLDTLADKVRQVNERLDAIEQKAAALFLSLHYKLAGDRERRLGDVVELHEEPVPVRADSEYPQVGVRGFGGGLFPKAAVAGTETSYRAFNRLYVDALVLSQVKGWEGALALCPAELAGMYVSPEYRTFRCVSGEATPAYIGELVRTPWFWSLLQDATRGVGARRERTRPEQFLNIELPMPPENMQRKVVEILDRQSRLRSRHATIRQANNALIPATLERVFSGSH